jgi:pyruvate,water dikinase
MFALGPSRPLALPPARSGGGERRFAAARSQAGFVIAAAAGLAGLGCSDSTERQWVCTIEPGAAPPSVDRIGCAADFLALASEPATSTIPGARSVKTSVDREVGFELSFQDSRAFPIHWDYLSEHRSAARGLPRVPMQAQFSSVEYYLPDRRFLLGSLTHYEGPDRWVYEISPYDTADAAMIQAAFERIADNAFIGSELYFHPTSLGVEGAAAELPPSVPRISTDELFAGVDYQALNVAESIGRLRFVTTAELEYAYLGYQDIVVLDHVPNDIAVTQGIITAEFQTPLSHINVLSRNRGTPNMALAGATTNADLRALEGQWVRLVVGATDYRVSPVEEAEVAAYWESNKPPAVQVPGFDASVTDLRDVALIVPADTPPERLGDVIAEATRAFGGKAANYGALSHVPGLNVPTGFAVPLYYYRQFMEQNGFEQRLVGLLADEAFTLDPAVRDQQLVELRAAMQAAPVDPAFEQLLMGKLAQSFPGQRMRFRSSTNAEDLDGFTGAGLYASTSGEVDDPGSVLDAVRAGWASVWSFRAFEERSYRSIDHLQVGMALLVHRSFPSEDANGVALTNNPFDPLGIEPAFYVNAQIREFSVVHPPRGTTPESFLHYYDTQNRPVSYLSESNLVAPGARVLSPAQVNELGAALDAIRPFFEPAYAPDPGSDPGWAMDVEFKFDAEEGEEPALFVKQARPFAAR